METAWVQVHFVFDEVELAQRFVSSPQIAAAMHSAGISSPMILLVLDAPDQATAGPGMNVVIAPARREEDSDELRPAAAVDTTARLEVDHNVAWAEISELKNPVVIAHFMAPGADRALEFLESPAVRDALAASGVTGRVSVMFTDNFEIAIRPVAAR